MVQEPGRVVESYIAMLRGSRGWQDLHEVEEYSLERVDDADEQ